MPNGTTLPELLDAMRPAIDPVEARAASLARARSILLCDSRPCGVCDQYREEARQQIARDEERARITDYVQENYSIIPWQWYSYGVQQLILDARRECSECGRECDELHETLNACQDCITTCHECEIDFLVSDSHRTSDDELVCESCANRYYRWSELEDCHVRRSEVIVSADGDNIASRSYADNNWYYDEESGDWYEEESNIGPGLLPPSASPFTYCQKRKDYSASALMFGVELEMEAREGYDQRDIITELGGSAEAREFILKEDGSLLHGVELVTMPLTLEQHRGFRWEKLLTDRLATIAKSGIDTVNCGIHIHVNRKALTALQLGKMLVFVNHPKTAAFISKIAQRNSNAYCRRIQKKVSDGADGKYTYQDDRYQAINLSKHGTAEFRIFRGNLRAERVLKNIEFCHALVMFCRSAGIRDCEGPEAFEKFLATERKTYPNLWSFLRGNSSDR